jgi:hypothetical protein
MKRVLVTLGAILLLNIAIPTVLGFFLKNGGVLIGDQFGIAVPLWLQDRLAVYPFLLYRPEIFVWLATVARWGEVEVFLTTCVFTTFTTTVTWLSVVAGERAVRRSTDGKLRATLEWLRARFAWFRTKLRALRAVVENSWFAWLPHLIDRYGTVLLFGIFALPVVPGTDTAVVIAAKLKRIPYAFPIFVGINTVKTALIITLVA